MPNQLRKCENCANKEAVKQGRRKVGKLHYLEEYAMADLYKCLICQKIYKWINNRKELTNF